MRALSAALLALLLSGGCAGISVGGAECPAELPELVDLRTSDPAPVVEIRYATGNNFTGAPLPGYETPLALLRRESAEALERAAQQLRKAGLGLKIWDAYRPARASRSMVEWANRTGNEWVVEEGYVAPESGHNRGNTVDLTLVRLDTGEELEMGTEYDEFTEAAHTDNAENEILAHRRTLSRALEAEGWENYPLEWWHFSYPTPAEPLDVPLSCYT